MLNEIISDKKVFYENNVYNDISIDYNESIISENMKFDSFFLDNLNGVLGLDDDLNYSSNNYYGSRYSYNSVRWMVNYLASSIDGNDYFRPAQKLESDIRECIYCFFIPINFD